MTSHNVDRTFAAASRLIYRKADEQQVSGARQHMSSSVPGNPKQDWLCSDHKTQLQSDVDYLNISTTSED
jgi:hypothetical protein